MMMTYVYDDVTGGIEFVNVDFKTYVTYVYDDDICV